MVSTDNLRIAFFGESVAYGFLLAPHFTPARYLEQCLCIGTGKNVTVLDETKVSIRIRELEERLSNVDAKSLDMAIIFAGNNWRKDFWNLKESDYKDILDEVDEEKSWKEAFEEHFQEWMNKVVQAFFDKVQEIFCKKQIPVLFIIPEFNLRGWNYNYYEKTSNWPNTDTEKLVDRNNITNNSIELADKINQLDSSNPLGYITKARYFDEQGEYDKAFTYYKEALNTNIYRLGPPPGINDYIRNSIYNAQKDKKLVILDSRKILNNMEQGEIAGNQYFLDYCHLNIAGIVKTCNEAASLISKILSFDYTEIQDNRSLLPSDEVISNSCFYSALHTGHSGNLNASYLEYLFDEAMRYDRGISDKMIHFAHLASEKIPWRLNKEYLLINSDQYPTIRQPADCMVMDVEIVDAIINVLRRNKIDIALEINKLRIENHSVNKKRSINLLETYYRETTYFNTFIDSKSIDYDSNCLSYCSFRNPSSNFYFISKDKNQLKCEVIMRSPYSTKNQEIKVYCNNNEVFSGIISMTWKKYEFIIDGELLYSDTRNELLFDWPNICNKGVFDELINQENFSSYDKMINRMRPIYGEIYELLVSLS